MGKRNNRNRVGKKKKSGGGRKSEKPPPSLENHRSARDDGAGTSPDENGGGGKQPQVVTKMPKLRFREGERVEYKAGSVWATGTVFRHWYDKDGDVCPYLIRADDGSLLVARDDVDECIKRSSRPLPELRFRIGDRVECNCGDWMPGTVTALWDDSRDRLYPFVVHLDEPEFVFVKFDEDWCIKELDEAPLAVVFSQGARVECKLRGGDGAWLPGTVITANQNYREDGLIPYSIRLDDQPNVLEPFWGPADRIRKTSTDAPKVEARHLRFKVGDRVECRTDRGWLHGTVIKTLHGGESHFESGFAAPYQVQLDGGNRIYAPFDADHTIRQSTIPPPTCWICFDNEQSETNVILRECVCRGEESGFAHVECLVQFALAKTQNQDGLGSPRDNPFQYCMTCKQPFPPDSRSFCALAKACYEVHGNDPVGSYWNMEATRMMSDSFTWNQDYDSAAKLLKKQIRRLRALVGSARSAHNEDAVLAILAGFLLQLAQVHEKKLSLDEMKESVDEAFALARTVRRMPGDNVLVFELSTLLGRHAHLLGDKVAALGYWNKCVHDDDTNYSLLNCAVLNFDLGNKEEAMELLSRALEMDTTVYGNEHTRGFAESLEKLRDGLIDEIPLATIGLADLDREFRLLGASSS